jgi:hypothetical protein
MYERSGRLSANVSHLLAMSGRKAVYCNRFGNGELMKGFMGVSGGLVTLPSPQSLSADSNQLRQRRKRANSRRSAS